MPKKPTRARSSHEIIVGNMARLIRQRACESNQTIEAYAVTMLSAMCGDAEAIALTISAIGRIAAEDERNGGGPLRAHERGGAR